MKPKTIIIFALALLEIALLSEKAYSQYVPCLKMVFLNEPLKGSFNPDSVMWDTCRCSDRTDHGCYYAKKGYVLQIPYHALILPEYKPDTLIFRDWFDIDSNYMELRNCLQNFTASFCNFKLQKLRPESIDSSSLGSRIFVLHLISYQLVDSVISYISKCKEVEDFYLNPNFYEIPDSYNDDLKSYISIRPNPVTDVLHIENLDNKLNQNQIQIFNCLGIKIYQNSISRNSLDIDFMEYPVGAYLLLINDKHTMIIKQ